MWLLKNRDSTVKHGVAVMEQPFTIGKSDVVFLKPLKSVGSYRKKNIV